MFDLFRLPGRVAAHERIITAMAKQVDQANAAIAQLKERSETEKAQVREAITGLKNEVEDLKTQVEELLTAPADEVDLTSVLAGLEDLGAHIEEIYIPESPSGDEPVEPTVPVDEPVAESDGITAPEPAEIEGSDTPINAPVEAFEEGVSNDPSGFPEGGDTTTTTVVESDRTKGENGRFVFNE
jgi:hypothetical protein